MQKQRAAKGCQSAPGPKEFWKKGARTLKVTDGHEKQINHIICKLNGHGLPSVSVQIW